MTSPGVPTGLTPQCMRTAMIAARSATVSTCWRVRHFAVAGWAGTLKSRLAANPGKRRP
jgi:hypothetical protein